MDLKEEQSEQYWEASPSQEVPPSNQLKALFYKNATLQIRQKKTVCCQLWIPFLLVTLVGVIQVEVNKIIREDAGKVGTNKTYDVKLGIFDPSDELAWQWTCWYSTDSPDLDEAVGSLFPNMTGSGMLGRIPQYDVEAISPKLPRVVRPYFVFFDSPEIMEDDITALKKQEIAQSVQNTTEKPCPKCPVTSYEFRDLVENASYVSLDYNMMLDTQLYPFSFPSNREIGMNMIHSAFLNDIYHNVFLPLVDDSNEDIGLDPTIFSWFRKMPYVTLAPLADVASFFAIFMLPLCLSFLLPVFVYGIVLEKQEKLRSMMLMMGLQMRWYWLVNYLFNFVMYIIVCLVVVIISLAFSLRIFTQTNPLILFISLLLWGYALNSLGILVSAFFSSSRTATIVGYLLVIASVIVSNTISITSDYEKVPNPIFLFYAPFAFFRIIFVFGIYCGVGECPDFGVNYNQLPTLWGFLLLDGTIYLLLGLYLDAVLPSQWGVPRHPLFPYYAIRNMFVSEVDRVDESKEHLLNMVARDVQEEGGLVGVETDQIVHREENFIRSKFLGTKLAEEDETSQDRILRAFDSGLLAFNLQKVYDGGFRAVKGVSLAVPQGECFGLLGPNGAGKTTTISMLTGLFPPTDGRARIGGYELSTELFKVHRVMGVCPQFDILWGSLTVRETILFYSRLKGIDSKHEKEHVEKSLLDVGLQNLADRQVKNLSGGQRRRVSLAVSLCGNARVVFLDEPTTGLDPVTRRDLWNVLLEMKRENRALILTTHSMEEADVLCDRIGIMALGEMKCLGTSLQLKNKYGSGYMFSIQYSPDQERAALDFLHARFPHAQQRDSFPGHLVYNLPSGTFRVSELFEVMISESPKHGIVDWGLTQATLEDVFLKIADNDSGPPADD